MFFCRPTILLRIFTFLYFPNKLVQIVDLYGYQHPPAEVHSDSDPYAHVIPTGTCQRCL